MRESKEQFGLREEEPSRTDRVLDVLDELPFAKGGRAGDLSNWDQISEWLRGEDFQTIEDFKKAAAEAIKSKNWINEKAPEIIMGHIDDVVELIKAFQEKKE